MAAPFRLTRRVLFHETDMAGVMHFSNFFRLMEEVEHAWWRSLGRSVHGGQGADVVSWPRVAATCEFTAPIRFEDELELLLSVGDVGSKSITVRVEFRLAGKRVAGGEMRAVCCRMEAGAFQALPIPAEIRAQLLEWKQAG